jgi:hypothetical protein
MIVESLTIADDDSGGGSGCSPNGDGYSGIILADDDDNDD